MTIWHSKHFWWCSGLEFNCKCYFFYLLVWTCTAVQRWGRLLLKWHNKRTVCPILKIKRPTETKKIVLSNSISNICKGFILKSYFWKNTESWAARGEPLHICSISNTSGSTAATTKNQIILGCAKDFSFKWYHKESWNQLWNRVSKSFSCFLGLRSTKCLWLHSHATASSAR